MVCRTKRYIKKIIYTDNRIKPETSILKKTELASRSIDESGQTIPIKSIGHFTKEKVKQWDETRGIYKKRDMHLVKLQGREGQII